MAAAMQHKAHAPAAFSSTKQQLAPLSSRPLRGAAPAARQQQQQHRAVLQPLQALSTSLRQPLVSGASQQQQPWQQQSWRQQQGQQQQQRRQQQRVLLVFAVAPEQAAGADGGDDDESGIDPNIPLVDQDFDLLGAEVRQQQAGDACI